MFNFIKQPANDPYNFDIGSKAPSKQVTKAPAAQIKPGPTSKTTAVAPTKQQPKNSTEKPKNIEAKRLGIRYDPPTISIITHKQVLEYLVPNTGKLYHHKMKLLKLKADTPPQHALEYLKKKHATFFINNKIPEGQLIDLIVKLTKRLPTTKPRPATASTIASKSQQKDIKSHDKVEPNSKFGKNPIIQNDDDDEEDEDEYDEDYEDQMTDEQYKMLYKQMGYDKLDFNKMTTQEILKHKQMMDNMLRSNGIHSQLDNEWDMEEDDDYDIV